MTFFKIMAMIG